MDVLASPTPALVYCLTSVNCSPIPHVLFKTNTICSLLLARIQGTVPSVGHNVFLTHHAEIPLSHPGWVISIIPPPVELNKLPLTTIVCIKKTVQYVLITTKYKDTNLDWQLPDIGKTITNNILPSSLSAYAIRIGR